MQKDYKFGEIDAKHVVEKLSPQSSTYSVSLSKYRRSPEDVLFANGNFFLNKTSFINFSHGIYPVYPNSPQYKTDHICMC